MATSVQPKDKTVKANGINLHYLDWGTEGKPKVLLLHGLRGHSHSWDDISAEFHLDYHIFALDQRGRGESDWAPDGDYSSEAFVTDLEAFCLAVGLDKFILVGHSMGGPVAIEAAVKLNNRVKAIIGVDTFHNIARGPASPFLRLVINTMFRIRQDSSTEDAVEKQFREDANQILKDWVSDKAETTDARASRGSLSSIISMDYPSQLKKIDIPILTLNSKFWMETDLDGGKKEYPGYEVDFVDGVGHYVMMEKPSYFNNWLENVLESFLANQEI